MSTYQPWFQRIAKFNSFDFIDKLLVNSNMLEPKQEIVITEQEMTMIKCLEMTIIGKCLFLLIPELTVFIFILLPKYLTPTSSKFLTFITIAQIMKSFTTIQDFWIHFCCLPKFRNDLKKEFRSIVAKCAICVQG